MIAGAHVLVYAEGAEEARAFLQDVLGFSNVDAGDGWLIFALPPAELGVHPATPGEERSGHHELWLMTHDLAQTREELERKGVEFSEPIREESFGLTTQLEVPGLGGLWLYEPRHASPLAEFS